MKNRSLVSIDDFSTDEILKILDLTEEFEKATYQQTAGRKSNSNTIL